MNWPSHYPASAARLRLTAFNHPPFSLSSLSLESFSFFFFSSAAVTGLKTLPRRCSLLRMSLSEGAVGLHQSHICRWPRCLLSSFFAECCGQRRPTGASNRRSVISCSPCRPETRRCRDVQISPWMGYTRRAVWVRQWLVFHMHRSVLNTCCFPPHPASVLLLLSVRWLIYQHGDGARETYAERPHGVMVELEPVVGGKGSAAPTNGLTLRWLIRGGSQWSTPGREQPRTASRVISYSRLGSSMPTRWQRTNLCIQTVGPLHCTESTSVPAASQAPCITRRQPSSFQWENQKSFYSSNFFWVKIGFYWSSQSKNKRLFCCYWLWCLSCFGRKQWLNSINHNNQIQHIVHFKPDPLNKIGSLSK